MLSARPLCKSWLVLDKMAEKGSFRNTLLMRKPGLWIQLFCLYLAVLTISCTHSVKAQAPAPSADRLRATVPADGYADDVGRFLAALPARPDSPFAKYQDQKAWTTHRHDLDTAWARLKADRLPAMEAFEKAEISSHPAATAPVFYPFSGPDTLTVTTFFPHAPVYVMVGLEPAGTLPTPKQIAEKNLDVYLAATRSTIASELGKSFFITRQMDREFRGQVSDGLCLPILELLVRSGHTILGFRYVRLDERGEIIERAADYHASGRIGNKGVEIEFRADDDQTVHKLFYFSVNLSDDRLKEDPQFLSFLTQLQGTTTFLKATSYMMHEPGFSTIRQQVLVRSGAVLQDDSGVPYHFYAAQNWQVQLYGEYVRPYGSFRWLEQQDLRNAYLTLGPKPLPFRIGYGFKAVPSNLQFATRMN